MRKTLIVIGLASLFAACTERPQVANQKGDEPAWKGAANPYVASGWKPGDEKSWEAQMTARAAAQNEYTRTQGSN
jgi:hypothetical protein